jgi:hypothetical protein
MKLAWNLLADAPTRKPDAESSAWAGAASTSNIISRQNDTDAAAGTLIWLQDDATIL